jgi:hypothetical protein
VRIVKTIDMLSHPHWMFRIVEKNKAQLKFHPEARYATIATITHKTKKINHFRLMDRDYLRKVSDC